MLKYLLLIFTIFIFTSCTNEVSKDKIKMGYGSWVGYTPFKIAKKNGYFKHTIEAHEIPNSSESIRLFKNGLLDIVAVTMDEAMSLYEIDKDISIILVIDHSVGADVVLANSKIKSIKDLKNKRIGYESGAVGAFLMAMVLKESGLSINDIKPKHISYHQHIQAYDNDEVDAIITFEPNKTELINKGAKSIYDSSKMPYIILDVLVVRKSLVDSNDPRLYTLVDAWFKAIDGINYDGIGLLDKKQNIELLRDEKILKISKDILKIMKENKLIANDDLDIKKLINADFLEGVKNEI